jgi:hypothetical protein
MKREVMLAAVGEGCKVNSSGLHAASNFVQDPLKDSDRISGTQKRKPAGFSEKVNSAIHK